MYDGCRGVELSCIINSMSELLSAWLSILHLVTSLLGLVQAGKCLKVFEGMSKHNWLRLVLTRSPDVVTKAIELIFLITLYSTIFTLKKSMSGLSIRISMNYCN